MTTKADLQIKLEQAYRDNHYFAERRNYWQKEAERLALLVRKLGGNPEKDI